MHALAWIVSGFGRALDAYVDIADRRTISAPSHIAVYDELTIHGWPGGWTVGADLAH